MTFTATSPSEVLFAVRDRLKARRLALDLTQAGLAKRAGVSLGTLKRFESKGLISFDTLLSISLVLQCLDDFDKIATVDPRGLSSQSLDQILESDARPRKKGRLR